MTKGSSEADMSSSLPPDITSSDNSSASHNSSSAAPNLIGNITRKVDRDPYEVYEHAKVLGSGSMVSHSIL